MHCRSRFPSLAQCASSSSHQGWLALPARLGPTGPAGGGTAGKNTHLEATSFLMFLDSSSRMWFLFLWAIQNSSDFQMHLLLT